MEFNDVLLLRQTVREYKKKQIEECKLQAILCGGMCAPISRKKYNDILFTVVQDKRLLLDIKDKFPRSVDLLYGVPTLIIVSSKLSKFKNIEHLNVACVIQNMLLAATSEGLGSIYLTSFLKCLDSEILNKLEIPIEYIPISAIGVGYKKNVIKNQFESEIIKRIDVIRK